MQTDKEQLMDVAPQGEILMIEDDPWVAEAASEALRHEGYTVTHMATAERGRRVRRSSCAPPEESGPCGKAELIDNTGGADLVLREERSDA